MKRSLLWAGVLSVACISAGFGNSLTGNVFDATTSAPISGAVVSTHILIPDSIGIFDTTDATGAYGITAIPSGNQIYVIMAWAVGYRQYYMRFDDLGAGSFEFNILLQREFTPPPGSGDSTGVGGRILGHSGTAGSLVPVEGANVSFSSGGRTYITTTGSEGAYQIKIPTGGYSISVSAEGYEPSVSSGVRVQVAGLSYGSVLRSVSTGVDDRSIAPRSFALNDPYPNPFNPHTTITFTLREDGWVNLQVYDLLGRDIATLVSGFLQSGSHIVVFDAAERASGVYLLKMTALDSRGAGHFSAIRRLLLLR